MDRMGTMAEIIFPTMGLTGFPGMVEDPELADAFARAYNRYISEFCSADPSRLHGAMLLSFNHPELAAKQALWGIEHGLRVAVTNPTPPADRAWSDPFYDPIWHVLADHGVTLAFHEVTTGCPPYALGVQRYASTYQMVYLVTHVVEAALGMTDMILAGTLHRFPGLKLLLAEAHAAWLPGWLATMDYTYTTVGMGSPYAKKRVGETALDMKPSDYFRRQCFVTVFPDDAMIEEAAEIGPESLLIASDWPHPVSDGRATVEDFAQRGDLDDELKRHLMVDNTERMLALQH
jgi:predicted TIM-barrel fold metal-dependent hydrolase